MNKQLIGLKEALEKNFNAPEVYMFKFIVPASNEAVAKIMAFFDDSSIIASKPSANGKYVSITARETMFSVDAIVEKYKLAFQIEGLIAL